MDYLRGRRGPAEGGGGGEKKREGYQRHNLIKVYYNHV